MIGVDEEGDTDVGCLGDVVVGGGIMLVFSSVAVVVWGRGVDCVEGAVVVVRVFVSGVDVVVCGRGVITSALVVGGSPGMSEGELESLGGAVVSAGSGVVFSNRTSIYIR